jgi:hypothetical protein
MFIPVDYGQVPSVLGRDDQFVDHTTRNRNEHTPAHDFSF